MLSTALFVWILARLKAPAIYWFIIWYRFALIVIISFFRGCHVDDCDIKQPGQD